LPENGLVEEKPCEGSVHAAFAVPGSCHSRIKRAGRQLAAKNVVERSIDAVARIGTGEIQITTVSDVFVAGSGRAGQ
jgi:hypothetical protein